MKGYTRLQAARRAGCSPRTLDRYVALGYIQGRKQYVPQTHAYMRLFTQEEIDHAKALYAQRVARSPYAARKDVP